eukprot:TRINITY_DN2019_c0_g1_i2.p1 TRINITY_DN2019_c0_g1~~TRINITY_DN2019_c0_g1_i2.p1  ORF type:complete len:370 (+),score=165.16 TRINITY_DN2019_c0_g1_i2:282-1391(+)
MGKKSGNTMVLNEYHSNNWNNQLNSFSTTETLYQYQFMSIQFNGKHAKDSSSFLSLDQILLEDDPPPSALTLRSSQILLEERVESSAESTQYLEEEEEKPEWIECEEEIEEESFSDYEEEEEEEEQYSHYREDDEEMYQNYQEKYYNYEGCRLRNTSHYKKEKISFTHKHINSNVDKRTKEKESVREFYNEKQKENAAMKTSGARWSNPFGPYNLTGSRSPARTRSTNSGRRSNRIQTQFDNDADLARAIAESRRDISRTITNISTQQASILADLQNRELTPEDYELLLLLDEGVKKKTIERRDVEKLPARLHDCSSCTGTCVVCMGDYEDGEKITKLPCGHEFHTTCIATWLTMSSVNCPTDNLPVNL